MLFSDAKTFVLFENGAVAASTTVCNNKSNCNWSSKSKSMSKGDSKSPNSLCSPCAATRACRLAERRSAAAISPRRLLAARRDEERLFFGMRMRGAFARKKTRREAGEFHND